MLVSFAFTFFLLRTISPSAAQPALDPTTLTSACGHSIVKDSIKGVIESRDAFFSRVTLVNHDLERALKTSEYPVPVSYEDGNWLAKEYLAENPYGVKVYDACLDQGHIMVIMELAQGLDIWNTIIKTERYRHTDTRETNILEDFCQVFDGVRFMHEKRCTHGDIHAHNVILTEAGAKIIDFDRTECWISSSSSDDDDYLLHEGIKSDGGRLSALLVVMMTPYRDNSDIRRLLPMMKETFDKTMTEELRSILIGVGFNEWASRIDHLVSDTAELYKSVCLRKPKLFKDPEPDDGQPST